MLANTQWRKTCLEGCHDYFYPKQFIVRGSHCFKEWSPWCWMVWSGSGPVLFIFPQTRGSQCFKEWSPWCWMVWSGSRPACLPLPFICLPVLFICGRVPGWLVSHFLSFVSQARSGWLTSFHLSPSSFHLSPRLGARTSFHLSRRLGACGGWRFTCAHKIRLTCVRRLLHIFNSPAHTGFASAARTSITFFFKHSMLPKIRLTCAHTN